MPMVIKPIGINIFQKISFFFKLFPFLIVILIKSN